MYVCEKQEQKKRRRIDFSPSLSFWFIYFYRWWIFNKSMIPIRKQNSEIGKKQQQKYTRQNISCIYSYILSGEHFFSSKKKDRCWYNTQNDT